ncbi:MAG: IgA Peptidase M64 [Bacteroidales bacterium]
MDYVHAGNAQEESFYFKRFLEEPWYAGPRKKLRDNFGYGDHFFKVYRARDSVLLYSRGYSTLFREWQTTAEAKSVDKAFEESVRFPKPKVPVILEISGRDTLGRLVPRFTTLYDPSSPFTDKQLRRPAPVFDVSVNGPTDRQVDIVLLPEGYTEEELNTFLKDTERFRDILVSFDPYTQYSDRFSIRAVWAPSPEKGSDIPRKDDWKATNLGTSFFTFDSERYCMTENYWDVADLAANAPYDQIYILVNTDKYGGGAIYNYYSVSVNGNLKAGKIFIHEFGHGFAGLGDEYYTSQVSYNDFYPPNIEPWEPNLTTLVNFNAKWKDMIPANVPTPTPDTSLYDNTVGLFEGGGYSAKGVYRPSRDCLMNSFKGDKFCPVCQEAIKKMIRFYTE